MSRRAREEVSAHREPREPVVIVDNSMRSRSRSVYVALGYRDVGAHSIALTSKFARFRYSDILHAMRNSVESFEQHRIIS